MKHSNINRSAFCTQKSLIKVISNITRIHCGVSKIYKSPQLLRQKLLIFPIELTDKNCVQVQSSTVPSQMMMINQSHITYTSISFFLLRTKKFHNGKFLKANK